MSIQLVCVYSTAFFFWNTLMCTSEWDCIHMKTICYAFWLENKHQISILLYYCQCIHIMQMRVRRLTRMPHFSWSYTRLILEMLAVLASTSWIIWCCSLVKLCTLALMNHMHTCMEVSLVFCYECSRFFVLIWFRNVALWILRVKFKFYVFENKLLNLRGW
jgi:hypothetical protein